MIEHIFPHIKAAVLTIVDPVASLVFILASFALDFVKRKHFHDMNCCYFVDLAYHLSNEFVIYPYAHFNSSLIYHLLLRHPSSKSNTHSQSISVNPDHLFCSQRRYFYYC